MGSLLSNIKMIVPTVILMVFTTTAYGQSCPDFMEGSCPLSEMNIILTDRNTNSPGLCQDRCSVIPECNFFTWFDTQCFLLRTCDFTEICRDCVSGPVTPDVDDCPWPPVSTTSEAPTSPTTRPTTRPTTKPTTPKPTTKPTTPSGCDNFFPGYICHKHDNELDHIEHIASPAECQSICQHRADCRFFSYYRDHDKGHCYLHWACDWLDNHDCRSYQSGGSQRRYESCVAGPKFPSYNDC